LIVEDWPAVPAPERFWLLGADSSVVNLAMVARMLGMRGTPLTIPRLAAGSWKVVRVDTLEQFSMLATGRGSLLPVVAKADLQPGELKRIHIAVPQ
jgi:hypothetical protein